MDSLLPLNDLTHPTCTSTSSATSAPRKERFKEVSVTCSFGMIWDDLGWCMLGLKIWYPRYPQKSTGLSVYHHVPHQLIIWVYPPLTHPCWVWFGTFGFWCRFALPKICLLLGVCAAVPFRRKAPLIWESAPFPQLWRDVEAAGCAYS